MRTFTSTTSGKPINISGQQYPTDRYLTIEACPTDATISINSGTPVRIAVGDYFDNAAGYQLVTAFGTITTSDPVTVSLGPELHVRTNGTVNVNATVPGPVSVTQGTTPWITAFTAPQDVNVVSSVEIEIKNDTGNPIPVNDPGLPDTLGQQTMAGSTSVTIASDQTAVKTGSATQQITSTGALINDTPIPTTDASLYSYGSFTVISTGQHDLILEGSEDTTNWFTIPSEPGVAQSLSGKEGASSFSVAGQHLPFTFTVRARYIRLRITGVTIAGTVTANGYLFTTPRAVYRPALGDVASVALLTNVFPGTTATNLGKAEDAAHTTGDVGVMALAVANETDANLSGTDGDYTPIATNRAGKLRGLGNTATELGKAEDAAHTTGDVGIMALSRRIDTAATSAGTSGDYATLNTDANGLLWARSVLDRPSQATGRTHTEKQARLTADGQVGSTVTGGKTFYVTSLHYHVFNTSLVAAGSIDIRDASSAGTGTIKIPIATDAATNQGGTSSTSDLCFTEPMTFSTGIYADFNSGTLTLTLVAVGYEE